MLTAGSKIGPYEIISSLGAGGMGEVYRAMDSRLNREVAIKVISGDISEHPDALSRFEREAKAVAALNHPNILSIFDYGNDEGITYAVMELLEGETLQQSLTGGPLPVSRVVDIAKQIASGLKAAHEKGITHRDLKPANIFLTRGGHVKILDFGLARVNRPVLPGDETLSKGTTVKTPTRPGIVMGTVGYMSPEQARGLPADPRSDIFAFGVVLYELLSGKKAFHGETASDTLAAILTRDPDPLPPVTSPALDRIVRRCLEKNRENRFQSAHDITLVLEAVSTPGSLTPSPVEKEGWWTRRRWMAAVGFVFILLLALLLITGREHWYALLFEANPPPNQFSSIAVLPMVNLSGSSDQDYFADGMTDEMISNLARISTIKVISRTTMMHYKKSTKSMMQIAKELNADVLIEGSVLKEEKQVRITIQLIDAQTDRHLWADSFERDLRDVIALQSEIAHAVVENVHAVLSPAGQTQPIHSSPVDPEAYELYLKGKFYLNKMTMEGYEKGLSYLQQAVEKDPSNPTAYAMLALAYSIIGHERSPEAFEQARVAARRAEELGGELPAELYLANGMAKLYSDWNYAGAEKDLKRAMELNSSLGEAHRDYSWYLYMVGRHDEALARMKRAQEVEPLNPLFYAERGWQYLWNQGPFANVIEEARKALELDSEFSTALYVLGMGYAEEARYDEARATHQAMARIDPDWKWAQPMTHVLEGRKEEARMILSELLSEKPDGTWAGWFLAEAYASMGDNNNAILWLETCYRDRHSFMPWILATPYFASLHKDQRFQDLVRRMDLP